MEGDPHNKLEPWRRARRQERRARLRRRRLRLAAVSALLGVLVAVAIVLIASRGSGGPASGLAASRRSATQAGGHHRAGDRASGHRHPSPTGPAHSHGTANNIGADPAALRLPRPAREVPVPILMYHVINPPPANAPFPGLYVPAPEFREQMQALAKAGWVAVTLSQLWSHWQQGTPLPHGKPIVLSFDNGYQSQYSNALPVLRRLGWKAIENMQLSGLPPSQGGLSEAQIKGLIAAGWELDTQGYSHAELIALSAPELRFQIERTRQVIQRRYHQQVKWFCYPSGHYNATVIAAVKRAGFIGSTTVSPGWASPQDNPYTLPRLRVLGGTSGPELLALIEATRENPAPPPAYE